MFAPSSLKEVPIAPQHTTHTREMGTYRLGPLLAYIWLEGGLAHQTAQSLKRSKCILIHHWPPQSALQLHFSCILQAPGSNIWSYPSPSYRNKPLGLKVTNSCWLCPLLVTMSFIPSNNEHPHYSSSVKYSEWLIICVLDFQIAFQSNSLTAVLFFLFRQFCTGEFRYVGSISAASEAVVCSGKQGELWAESGEWMWLFLTSCQWWPSFLSPTRVQNEDSWKTTQLT